MSPMIERVSVIPPVTNSVLEGPHWDVNTQSLYFVDVMSKYINKYVPATGQHTKAKLDKDVAFIIPVKDTYDKFIIGQEREIAIATWDGVSTKPSKIENIIEIPEVMGNKLNDAKCDSSGLLWAGTLGKGPGETLETFFAPTGALYSLHKGQLNQHLKNINLSNGLDWDNKREKFYYIDSCTGGIDEFDFDLNSGTLANRRNIFSAKSKYPKGMPDGMTIDSEGNIWVALFGANRVVKIDPRKPERVTQEIQLPAQQVTSLAWGGPQLDTLFVTTGNMAFPGEVLTSPDDGSLYKITGLGAKGLPANNFVL